MRLGGTDVLRGVDTEATAGRVTAVIGPNGAGKSTLLRALCGLLRPRQGTVAVDDVPVHSLSPRSRARRLGLVPQDHRVRYPFTVDEVVRMGRYAHRGPLAAATTKDLDHVERAMRTARVEHLFGRRMDTLSGGERQRVMIARVLAQDPHALLLDEPTASLDLHQAHHAQGLLRALADAGKIVVVVLHDLEQATRVADDAVLLTAGQVAQSGPIRDVVSEATLKRAYGVDVDVSWGDEAHDGARIRVRQTPSA